MKKRPLPPDSRFRAKRLQQVNIVLTTTRRWRGSTNEPASVESPLSPIRVAAVSNSIPDALLTAYGKPTQSLRVFGADYRPTASDAENCVSDHLRQFVK